MVKLSLAAVIAATFVFVAPAAEAGVNEGERAPEFVSVKDLRGRRVTLRSYRGKVVVLTFGASWCKPCKHELPALSRIAGKFPQVQFIAINIDKNANKGRTFIKRYVRSPRIRSGLDTASSTVQLYEPPTMPSTYIIGKYGVVRHRHRGYREGDENKLAAKLRSLLK